MKITSIAAVSWGVNRLDIFGLGTNNEMFHKAWDGREWLPSPTEWEALGGVFSTRFGLTAPQLATSRTINSGALTSDLPLGGSVGIVMNENGDFDFTSHAHDSGFDNIDYTISAAIMTPDGFAFTFQHSGSTEGTVAGLSFGTPNRDSDFNTGAENNPLIGTHWDGVLKGTFTARIDGTDTLVGGIEKALGDLVQSLAAELGKDAATGIVALLA